MRGIKYLLGLLLILNFYGITNAQNSFSVSRDSVVAIKPSTAFVFYNYTEFENHTDDTLQMRWIKTETISSIPGEPGNVWDIGIQDHINFFNPANFLDSADFYIPPVTGAYDKFLLHLFPNGQAGNLVVKFLIFPIDDPSDAVTVTFDYTSIEVTSLSEKVFDANFKVFPNPAKDFVSVVNLSNEKVQADLFSPEGKLIRTFPLGAKEELYLPNLEISAGIYYLKMENSKISGIKNLVIVPNKY